MGRAILHHGNLLGDGLTLNYSPDCVSFNGKIIGATFNLALTPGNKA